MFLNRLRAARKYPVWQWPAVAGKKVVQKIEARRRRAGALRGELGCSEQRLLATAGVSTRAALRVSLADRSRARFFLDGLTPPAVADHLHGARAAAVFAAADALCRHQFDLLGSGPTALGPTIDWQRDFKSGYVWDRTMYYKDFESNSPAPGVDIKVPWELSRFQHAVTLGKADWLARAGAGDTDADPERYAREFVAQLLSWCDANPVPFGVNWVCTMDVAIRIVNLIWGYFLVRHTAGWTEDVELRFLRAVIEHGEHILANPEKPTDGVTSNHYLSDVVGLVYLGVSFPQLAQAQQWRAVGVAELVAEMAKQVCADGADYESSIPYHRLVLELFASAAWLCRLNGIDLPAAFWQRLERMFEFTLHYTRPDGLAPQIGDTDDGRLHILADYGTWDRRDHRYLLAIGARMFDREDFASAAGEQWEEAFWLCGERASAAHARASNLPLPLLGKEGNPDCTPSAYQGEGRGEVTSRGFPDSGFYFMRSSSQSAIRNPQSAISSQPHPSPLLGKERGPEPQPDQLQSAMSSQPHPSPVLGKERGPEPQLDQLQSAIRNPQSAIPLYLAIAANPVGTGGIGNHKHNDLLSFELYAGDKAFIIDPGTYVYTPAPEWRNRLRSTAAHNTIRVDAEEQNRFDERLLFAMTPEVRPRVHRWVSNERFDLFDGEHDGYRRLSEPITHRRQVYFDKFEGFWLMRDLLFAPRPWGEGGEGLPHRFDLHLHFAPLPVELHADDGFVARTHCATGTNLAVVPLRADGWHVALETGWVSYSYGTKVEAPVVRYSTVAAAPAELVLVYWPFEGQFDAAKARAQAAAVEWGTTSP
jgi:uncharacterized heparinase superfamily protein